MIPARSGSKGIPGKNIKKLHGKPLINYTIEAAKEIFENTPMPWAPGRSWVEGIERGISGVGKYLKIDSRKGVASRSGAGLQVKNGPMSGSFRNTKYLSQILNDLRSSIVRKTK